MSECTPFNRCGSCWPNNCFQISKYTVNKAKEFGGVSGRDKMKVDTRRSHHAPPRAQAEIYHRGPIACGVGVTPHFDNYTGGIYSERSSTPINHIISVVGWGKQHDSGVEYWIGRNSWGTPWASFLIFVKLQILHFEMPPKLSG